ncbi:hypothetical protein SLA2020_282090 [Shorea laevis]
MLNPLRYGATACASVIEGRSPKETEASEPIPRVLVPKKANAGPKKQNEGHITRTSLEVTHPSTTPSALVLVRYHPLVWLRKNLICLTRRTEHNRIVMGSSAQRCPRAHAGPDN